MSARIVDVENGLVTVRIVGRFSFAEWKQVHASTEEVLAHTDKIRVLILAEDFEGWEKDGNWGDLSFSVRIDDRVEKMAIVGEQRWEDLALLFAAKGLRSFPVEYFLPKDIRKARQWLAEETVTE